MGRGNIYFKSEPFSVKFQNFRKISEKFQNFGKFSEFWKKFQNFQIWKRSKVVKEMRPVQRAEAQQQALEEGIKEAIVRGRTTNQR